MSIIIDMLCKLVEDDAIGYYLAFNVKECSGRRLKGDRLYRFCCDVWTNWFIELIECFAVHTTPKKSRYKSDRFSLHVSTWPTYSMCFAP